MKKKRFISIFIIFLIMPAVLNAANPSELEQQIEQVRQGREVLIEEQKKLEAELEVVNSESQSLGGAVKSLDATRKKLAKDINITRSKITSTNLTIRLLENTMGEKEQQISVHRKAIAYTLSTLSEYDSRPLILSLLSSTGLSDLWRDRSQIEGLNGRLEEEIEVLRKTRKILSQEKEQKEKVKKEQVSLQSQLSGQKSVVEENQKVKTKLLTETKNKETEYQKTLAENLARQKEFEEDLFRLESELKITLDPSLIPSSQHGILSWPLSKIYITDPFGRRPTRLHNGVDFRASVGTPVKTVFSGVVQGIGNTDDQKGCYSYGRWILVKHVNGLSSVYAHLSASIVQTGQSVKTGDIIGYSGGYPRAYGSGNSRGPHLHLGLFASQGVEIRQFTSQRYLNTGSGCNQVSIPVADTKAYLDPLAYLPVL
ncbi:MAG: peptidoglycan DD-metalloendopeptidase family protein [bacterium]|nr:peptidoglycan DD-metalloendopeptidase family protein [bacterium]